MDFKLEHHDAGHFVALHSAEHADLKAVADHCANLRSIGATGSKDMKYAASVPGIFIMQYCNINGIEWAEFFRDHTHADRMLADPALADFRVWKGRI